MSATDTFENNLLRLIFNATAIPNIAQNNGTSPATILYISLHTSDPEETGDQTTSEANYTSYNRATVTRNTSGWSVVGNTASNAATVNFPAATGGSSVVTHFGIGLSATGTGNLLFKGALDQSLAISNGITPSFNTGDISVIAD